MVLVPAQYVVAFDRHENLREQDEQDKLRQDRRDSKDQQRRRGMPAEKTPSAIRSDGGLGNLRRLAQPGDRIGFRGRRLFLEIVKMIGQLREEPVDVGRRQAMPGKPVPHLVKPRLVAHVRLLAGHG